VIGNFISYKVKQEQGTKNHGRCRGGWMPDGDRGRGAGWRRRRAAGWGRDGAEVTAAALVVWCVE
jgi:hypothetical protein